ncbi:alpha/beta fold hydrolase [Aquimarina sediminis]|uniref:alpha/beta fold hydrolase n=1 Tax=Aquimarina sediminis TaxID=2070536 RepID=UPI000CA053BE|nr:alpha/beta fold hydrolase [Aquimarina sediminis]
MKVIKKFLKVTGFIVIGIIAILFAFLYFNSTESTPQFKDEQGRVIKNSIAEMKYITIGGVEQFVLIRGNNKNNPLLLILHGGPGAPELPMFRKHNRVLENHFTVAYWDQRGAGKSTSPDILENSFTLQQSIVDAHELTKYLKREYQKEKIFLFGHSWGSLLGLKTVSEFPDDYFAFIGTGQMVNQPKSDSLSYEFIKKTAQRLNDKKALTKLDEIGSYSKHNIEKIGFINWLYYQRVLLSVFGGAIADSEKTNEVFLKPILYCNEYTIKEKWQIVKSNSKSAFLNSPFKKMTLEVLKTNISEIRDFKIPIYIIQGKKDFITNYSIAKEYYDKLNAPKKKFYTFENSAHFPAFEEPEKFNNILINEILNEFKYLKPNEPKL